MFDETRLQTCRRAVEKLVLEKTGVDISMELQFVSQLEKTLHKLEKLVNEGCGTVQVQEIISGLTSALLTGYITRLAKTTHLQSEAEKMDESSEGQPGEIQPVVSRLKLFIGRCKQAKQEVEELLKSIEKMINERMDSFGSFSERDLKQIRNKKLDLDAAMKIWGNLISKTESVLSEFDRDIKAYQERESRRAKWTLTCVLAVVGLSGGAAAVGFGLGGILGVGIGLKASAAGASIGGGVTVSGACASVLGLKLKQKYCYWKEEQKVYQKYQEFKKEIDEIKHDYDKMSYKREILLEKIYLQSS